MSVGARPAGPVAELFDRMDEWRHFPKYQLERRADIFFSIYLPEVLEAKLGFPMRPELAPEFPVRKGTIDPHIQTDDPCNIDYLAVSASGASQASTDIVVTAPSTIPHIVYVQPNDDGPDGTIVSFREFADMVAGHPDPVSQRFAASLREWARVQAGG